MVLRCASDENSHFVEKVAQLDPSLELCRLVLVELGKSLKRPQGKAFTAGEAIVTALREAEEADAAADGDSPDAHHWRNAAAHAAILDFQCNVRHSSPPLWEEMRTELVGEIFSLERTAACARSEDASVRSFVNTACRWGELLLGETDSSARVDTRAQLARAALLELQLYGDDTGLRALVEAAESNAAVLELVRAVVGTQDAAVAAQAACRLAPLLRNRDLEGDAVPALFARIAGLVGTFSFAQEHAGNADYDSHRRAALLSLADMVDLGSLKFGGRAACLALGAAGSKPARPETPLMLHARAVLLRHVVEGHGHASTSAPAAVSAALRSLEADLVLACQATDPSSEAYALLLHAAEELARCTQSLLRFAAVFRHHVASLLAHHITACYVSSLPRDARRALDAAAFHLLDLCTEHELQQLHAVLGGGRGGGRREALRVLREAHARKAVFVF